MKLRILLIDDDCDDRQLFARALKKGRIEADLFEATDGSAAINYLLGNKPYDDRTKYPFPDLIFLDLKMPAMDGLDVLKVIRTKLGLQNLPIIVLTNSNIQADVFASYALSASSFHQKPHNPDDLIRLLQQIIPLWLSVSSSLVREKRKET
jgi:two-component system response regulator